MAETKASVGTSKQHMIKMASIGFSLHPNSPLFSSCAHKTNFQTHHIIKFRATSSIHGSSNRELLTETPVSEPDRTSFKFKNLTETFWIDVHRAEGRPLKVKLTEPLKISSSRIEHVENVAIRFELSNGCVGWGEVTGSRDIALVKVKEACEFLKRSPTMTLNFSLDEISKILPGPEFSSIRAGVEMALIDAVATSIDVPLWRLFGGVSNTLSSAIAIPSTSSAKASELASKYSKRGFKTFKLNLSKNLNSDIDVLQAIRSVHPQCSFILDANEAYHSEEAINVLEKLDDMGIAPILFEQPVHRDDWRGLKEVSVIAREKYGTSVAADESCKTLNDIQRVKDENIADVINIKISKFGVLGTLKAVETARRFGLDLMMDGAIETKLATGVAGHLAAGLGCFKYVNLSMPMLLADDPVVGGYEVCGSNYKFVNSRGQGGFLKWDFMSCHLVHLIVPLRRRQCRHQAVETL